MKTIKDYFLFRWRHNKGFLIYIMVHLVIYLVITALSFYVIYRLR